VNALEKVLSQVCSTSATLTLGTALRVSVNRTMPDGLSPSCLNHRTLGFPSFISISQRPDIQGEHRSTQVAPLTVLGSVKDKLAIRATGIVNTCRPGASCPSPANDVGCDHCLLCAADSKRQLMGNLMQKDFSQTQASRLADRRYEGQLKTSRKVRSLSFHRFTLYSSARVPETSFLSNGHLQLLGSRDTRAVREDGQGK